MSDYSRPYTDEDAKLEARRGKVEKKLRKRKLSTLTVQDLFIILDAYGYRHGYIASDSKYYIERIEKILKG